MNIEWKTPPESTAQAAQTPAAPFVEALKQNPGRWAYYGRRTPSVATYLRRRYGVEAVSRAAGDNGADIYARWNG